MAEQAERRTHTFRIVAAAMILVLMALGVGSYWYFVMRGIVYSDDARFSGHLVDLAPELAGTLSAVCGKQKLELQRTTVIVLKPTKIGKPYPSASGKATIMANMVVDAKSSPAYTGPLQKGFVKLASLYGQKLTVTVWDQFDKPLDRIYAGSPISEENVPINQFLTGNGTYTDPVGKWWFPPISEVPKRSDPAMKWPLEPMLPLQGFYSSRPALQVEVDGIPLELAPGRTVVGIPPDQIEVLW